MTDFDPTTNLLPCGMLTKEKHAALEAWPHGWECYSTDGIWVTVTALHWLPCVIYRGKPGPKRIVTWHNVYEGRLGGWFNSREEADDQQLKDRLCVYRITRNEDGSDPQIEVDGV